MMSVHSMEVTVAIIDERASFGIDTSSRVVRDPPAEAALPGGFSAHFTKMFICLQQFHIRASADLDKQAQVPSEVGVWSLI